MELPLEAWILTIGNEIVNGVISDTNRETIARELRSVGIPVKGMSSVGDDPTAIVDALNQATERAAVTVVSGGLGPTADDKTAEAAAKFLGVALELDAEQLARIEERFRQRGRIMSPSNTKQAFLPTGCAALPNDYGTAPGFIVEKRGRVALFLPGVPREMVGMLQERAIPAIFKRFGAPSDVFRTRTLIVYGLTESQVGEILGDAATDEKDYHLAFLPRFPVIRLRMDVISRGDEEANRMLDGKQRIIVERLGENVISDDGRSMEQVVLELLQGRRQTVALAESITGGMIGDMLTRVPGSSKNFMGSIVSYSNDMKSRLLGVTAATLEKFGAVSHKCAREMAVGAANSGRADIGLSVTGIAGPDGGTADKPVGTFFVGLATPESILTRAFLLPGTRDWVKTLAAMQALDMLRRWLLGYRIQGKEED
jgi:nicotinamide-nucleotide amidase